MYASAIAWILVAVLAGDLDVRGGSTCPTPADVAERTASLLSPEQGLPSGLILRVEGIPPAEIEVRLEGEGQPEPIASRRLPRSGSCGELAEAVAVVAASWAGRYDTSSSSSAKSALLEVPAPTAAVRDAPAASPARPVAWSVGGAGWLGGAATGGITPHGGVELTVAWRGTHWFGRLMLGGTGERLFPVDTGNARWWRLLVMPSVGRVWGESVFFEASAGPVVGPVFVNGQGFSPNTDDVGLDVGVSPALRLGYRLGAESRIAVWMGISAIAWLRPHRLSVDVPGNPATFQTTLPRLDLMAGVGLNFALGR